MPDRELAEGVWLVILDGHAELWCDECWTLDDTPLDEDFDQDDLTALVAAWTEVAAQHNRVHG